MMKINIIIIAILISNLANANYSISPMNREISIPNKTTSYTLENLSNIKSAYIVSAYTREINENGKEIRRDTNELRIFPKKVILAPGQKKKIKVMYTGSKSISKERSYRVIFNQKNIAGDNIDVMKAKYEFITALYVTPKNAEYILSTKVISKDDMYTNIAIYNSGTKHKVLDDWEIELMDDNGNKSIYGSSLPGINVLAKSEVFLKLINKDIKLKEVSNVSLMYK